MDILPNGSVIGRCRIIKFLGKGGMGAVYKAHHLNLDIPVALKVLNKDLASSPEQIERFYREARASAKLKSPYIVEVKDVGEDSGIYYIIMEFIEGEPLSKKIKREGPLSLDIALPLLLQITLGLDEAHKKNIIHRDIKPDNILINREGVAKILDFGLAKLVKGDSNLTQSGEILGTPYYLSPEQCEGKKIDHRSDIYNLGITFYHMLTKDYPFKGDSPLIIAAARLRNDPIPPTAYNPNIPKDIEDFTLKMIERDINKRFQNTQEIINSLNLLLSKYTLIDNSSFFNKIAININNSQRINNNIDESSEITQSYEKDSISNRDTLLLNEKGNDTEVSIDKLEKTLKKSLPTTPVISEETLKLTSQKLFYLQILLGIISFLLIGIIIFLAFYLRSTTVLKKDDKKVVTLNIKNNKNNSNDIVENNVNNMNILKDNKRSEKSNKRSEKKENINVNKEKLKEFKITKKDYKENNVNNEEENNYKGEENIKLKQYLKLKQEVLQRLKEEEYINALRKLEKYYKFNKDNNIFKDKELKTYIMKAIKKLRKKIAILIKRGEIEELLKIIKKLEIINKLEISKLYSNRVSNLIKIMSEYLDRNKVEFNRKMRLKLLIKQPIRGIKLIRKEDWKKEKKYFYNIKNFDKNNFVLIGLSSGSLIVNIRYKILKILSINKKDCDFKVLVFLPPVLYKIPINIEPKTNNKLHIKIEGKKRILDEEKLICSLNNEKVEPIILKKLLKVPFPLFFKRRKSPRKIIILLKNIKIKLYIKKKNIGKKWRKRRFFFRPNLENSEEAENSGENYNEEDE